MSLVAAEGSRHASPRPLTAHFSFTQALTRKPSNLETVSWFCNASCLMELIGIILCHFVSLGRVHLVLAPDRFHSHSAV